MVHLSTYPPILIILFNIHYTTQYRCLVYFFSFFLYFLDCIRNELHFDLLLHLVILWQFEFHQEYTNSEIIVAVFFHRDVSIFLYSFLRFSLFIFSYRVTQVYLFPFIDWRTFFFVFKMKIADRRYARDGKEHSSINARWFILYVLIFVNFWYSQYDDCRVHNVLWDWERTCQCETDVFVIINFIIILYNILLMSYILVYLLYSYSSKK